VDPAAPWVWSPEKVQGRAAAPTFSPRAYRNHHLVIPVVAILATHEFVRMRFPLPPRIRMILEKLIESRMFFDVPVIVD
jgi:hypothetical protein